MQAIERTKTPQEHFPHVGSLENQDAIAHVAKQMLQHTQYGLWTACIETAERDLLTRFEELLSDYQQTSREQWASLKENCLKLLGSQVATTIDHLVSAMRTPAIAESAIRSAGFALIAANEAKAKAASQTFIREMLSSAIQA